MISAGMGKTYAYMIPIIERLLKHDSNEMYPRPMTPRCIILLPTRELVAQTLRCVRQFPIHSIGCSAGLSYAKELREIREKCDVIVCTPWRLLLHIQKRNLSLKYVTHVVVDEADTLLDSFYHDEICNIFNKLLFDKQIHDFKKAYIHKNARGNMHTHNTDKNMRFEKARVPVRGKNPTSTFETKHDHMQDRDIILVNDRNKHNYYSDIHTDTDINLRHADDDIHIDTHTPEEDVYDEDEEDELLRTHTFFEDFHIQKEINPIFLHHSHRHTQNQIPSVTLVCATHTKAITQFLHSEIAQVFNFSHITDESAHNTVTDVRQIFVPTNRQEKMDRLFEALDEHDQVCLYICL